MVENQSLFWAKLLGQLFSHLQKIILLFQRFIQHFRNEWIEKKIKSTFWDFNLSILELLFELSDLHFCDCGFVQHFNENKTQFLRLLNCRFWTLLRFGERYRFLFLKLFMWTFFGLFFLFSVFSVGEKSRENDKLCWICEMVRKLLYLPKVVDQKIEKFLNHYAYDYCTLYFK